MPSIKVKKGGVYADPVGIFAKKAGVYSAVAGVSAKVGGAYVSVDATVEQRIAALFAAGEQGADWSDIRPQTVWQDPAGTIPGAVGQMARRIVDKSGRGNHLLQNSTAAAPILQQDSGGRYYLQLDGVDDGFGCAISGWSSSMLVATALQPASTARNVLWAESLAGSRFFGVSLLGDGSAPYDASTGTPLTYVDGALVTPNTRGALNAALGSGVSHVEDSYPLNLSTYTGLLFGNFIAWIFQGRFYGAIATTHSDAPTAVLLRKHLGQKAGLSL